MDEVIGNLTRLAVFLTLPDGRMLWMLDRRDKGNVALFYDDARGQGEAVDEMLEQVGLGEYPIGTRYELVKVTVDVTDLY